MALLLREDDVHELLTVQTAVDLLDAAFRDLSAGTAENRSRTRIPYQSGQVHVMGSTMEAQGVAGTKAYVAGKAGITFLVTLFDLETNTVAALIEADLLGRIRTGAASALATKYMAKADAQVAAIIGTGGQAMTQAEGLCTVRPITRLRVYGRDPSRRAAFADSLRARVNAEVVEAKSPRLAVEGSDIVTTITTSRDPVFEGAWLSGGTHVNAAGGNVAHSRELDDVTFQRAGVVATDDVAQARIESGDLIGAVSSGALDWEDVTPLQKIVTGEPGRRGGTAQLSIFESQGIALEDVAVAKYVYYRALEAGRGQHVAFGGTE